MTRHVAGAFQPLLEVLVGARRMRGVRPIAGVAVEMGQELVAELFELDQQVVGRRACRPRRPSAAALVRELGPLVEHHDALDLRAGDEEELLVLVGVSFLKLSCRNSELTA